TAAARAEPEFDAGAAGAVHAQGVLRGHARRAVLDRHLLRDRAGAAGLQPGAVADAARRRVFLVPAAYRRVRAGAVHPQRLWLRVRVAGLAVDGRRLGPVVDLPGADRHADVLAQLPGTARALAGRQRGQPVPGRLLRAARDRLAVAAVRHRHPAGVADRAGRAGLDPDRGGGDAAPRLPAGAAVPGGVGAV